MEKKQEKTTKISQVQFKKKLFLTIKKLKDNNLLTNLISAIFGFLCCLILLSFITGGRNFITTFIELSDFITSYVALAKNYYQEIDKNQVVTAAINGMMSSIDDTYTTFIDSNSSQEFNETVEGKYNGIGCTVSMSNGNIIIIGIFDNTPAAQANLQVGDIITKVNDEDYTNKTSEDMANYIKNFNDSQIKLTVLRENQELEITISREEIEIPTISHTIYTKNEQKIGYIAISSFSSVTFNQFQEALKQIEKEEIAGLVIDVRNNSGGYLTTVTEITELFLKKGKIIYNLEKDDEIITQKSTTKTYREYPIAILINKASASASEILASAIKESYEKSFIVGTNSYGKGTVQQTLTLKDGSILKYTTQKWLTPDKNWINEIGVEPTDYVELDQTYLANPLPENDNQLQTALSKIINEQ